MKDSLNHLPQRKRHELARIVSTIRELVPQTEMLILFGSYARGDWVEDVTLEGFTTYEYLSDFDILVIVKDKALADEADFWDNVEKKAGRHPVRTSIKLIAHDIAYVNRQLEKGQYFFTDIKKEGIILYDSKNCQLAEPKELSPKERLGQAKADFKHWFGRGNEFYRYYEFGLENKLYETAAFNLHQAAECFYGTMLLVYTNYKPKAHDIDKLGKMAAEREPAFIKIFPRGTKEEKRRFDLLKQAYVGARYNQGYKITAEELKYLARCVELLQQQTKVSCEAKMGSFV